MSNKELLLSVLLEGRLRSLATTWGHAIQDRRLRAPGIAKELARKRSLDVTTILEAMNEAELAEACRRVGLAVTGTAAMRRALNEGLERAGWRVLRKEATAGATRELVALEADLLDVIDGDTLRVRLEGQETLVRIRGIDTPETFESDKAEEDLDRTKMNREEMVALGEEATVRVRQLLRGRRIFLHCESTPMGPKPYLHHRQYRLLAFVTLDGTDGQDLGRLLLEDGYALVWPRNVKTRRYLHVKSDDYIRVCHEALEARPGLWNQGLSKLCPRYEHPGRAEWTIEDCRAACLAPVACP